MTGARRVLIAGAGVTGLLTAVSCALAGHRVTVLDRGAIPNPHSGSFDQHRAIRALRPGDGTGTRAAVGLHQRWSAFETLLGARFYRRVGAVTTCPAGDLDAVLELADITDVAVTIVDPRTLPHLVFPDGHVGVRESDAGVLLADRVLHAATRWLRSHPAVTLRPGREVVAVDTDRARVALRDGTVLHGDLLLVATGAGSRELVDLPIVLHRQTMLYLRPPADLAPWWEHAPCLGGIGRDGRAWLIPPGAGTLLKISSAQVCREVGTTAESDDEQRWTAELTTMPILADPDRYTVASVRRCHYTVDARTGGAHLEQIGPAVWARAAVGGDGFHTAPLVADRLVEAAAQRPAA
ncbi:MAG TPA: FAD-binding oxidoreductase [Aldersonia sp.]